MAGYPLPPRSDSKTIFATIDDEIRDAKRVASHGQEEDLKQALTMVIGRVSELSSKLKEAYKTQQDLQTSLDVAKSNLQLVMANNEMLEDALKNTGGNTRDVGWRTSRNSIAEEDRRRSADFEGSESPTSPPSPYIIPPTPPADSRFFRSFRFGNSSSPQIQTVSGRSTPTLSVLSGGLNISSPSLPSLAPLSPGAQSPAQSPGGASKELGLLQAQITQERVAFERERRSMEARAREADTELKERARQLEVQRNEMLTSEREALRRVEELESEKEMERRGKDLEKKERERVLAEKEALEGEIESLSQALFEEANKMVASERIRRHETEEELREAKLEKEALRSALRLIEGHKMALTRSRSSSDAAIKSPSSSRAHSPILSIRAPSSPSQPSSPAFSMRSPSPALSMASFSMAARRRRSMDSSRSFVEGPLSPDSLEPPQHTVSVPTSPGDIPFPTPTTEASDSFFPQKPTPVVDTAVDVLGDRPEETPVQGSPPATVHGASPWADVPSSPVVRLSA